MIHSLCYHSWGDSGQFRNGYDERRPGYVGSSLQAVQARHVQQNAACWAHVLNVFLRAQGQ